MRSIPTRYAGCYFRSRLEARWAVFFDKLHIPWQYEPEGFDLGGAGFYLPDFRITVGDRERWIEVKPLPMWQQLQGLDELVDARDLRRMAVFSIQEGVDLEVVGEFGRTLEQRSPAPGEAHQPVLEVWSWVAGHPRGFWAAHGEAFGRGGPDIMLGWRAARSARFEFGQEGAS